MSAVQEEMRAGGDSRRGGRRSWSRAEKSRIIDEAFRPGASAADVARGYGLNANQVFNWRRALAAPAKTKRRAAALTAPAEASAESQAAFVSVGMVVPTRDDALALTPSPLASVAGVMPLGATPGERAGLIEIDLICGTRLRVDAFVDGRALRRVLSAMRASS